MTRLALVAAMLSTTVLASSQTSTQSPAAAGVTGTWTVPDTPWSMVLKQDGVTVSGKVMQGAQEAEIYDGKMEGTTVSFKFKSPDQARTITLVGKVSEDDIAFIRTVEVKEGGAPGGAALFGGPAGPSDLKAIRTPPDTDVWAGTARNAPNPNNPNAVPPPPRAVSVAMRKMPDPLWRWRGEGKTIDTRVLVQNNQPVPLISFVHSGDRLSFDYSQGAQAVLWVCALARQTDGQFSGGCRPETGNNPGFFITLTPPKEGAERP
jgi:hypothetical protein